jgi:osmoprotectant transport system permease protein
MIRALLELAREERWELLAATAAHLDLVLEALLVAVVVGVPLGVAASRSKHLERAVIAIANVLQTVPSLALLGFLLIVFRDIGKGPARAALVVYALLPIIKNTLLGLRGIDCGVAEAALGMGMTPWQRLSWVELPLAVPAILGGVRIATVAAVGMATIAAAIGAKGLGGYIFRGVDLSDPRLILLGSIPAALLALACDAALGGIEHALDPSRPRPSRGRAMVSIGVVTALILLALWGAFRDVRAARGGAIVIGSKNAGESILLGEMLAQLVEAKAGLPAERRFGLGGNVCYEALKHGGIDAYAEYTGTALTVILKEPPQYDPKRVLARIREVMSNRDDVACLDPLGFENTFAILVRRKQAEQLGLKTISDIRTHEKSLRAGFGYEFMSRPDGYPGLVRAYGLHFATPPREMERGLLYEALAAGRLDVAAGDSTDGRIAALDLRQLIDDRRYFPPYEAVVLARGATLRSHPGLADVLNLLSGKLDAATMRRLNDQVDRLRRPPADVALEFLRSRGLLP